MDKDILKEYLNSITNLTWYSSAYDDNVVYKNIFTDRLNMVEFVLKQIGISYEVCSNSKYYNNRSIEIKFEDIDKHYKSFMRDDKINKILND